MLARWVAVAVLLFSSSAWASGSTITLVYSGNQDGELEPCGCSIEGDLGGILRQATMLKQLRGDSPDMFTVSSGGLIVSMSPQDKLTGEYILKGYAQLGYDAIGVQWPDLAYGQAFIRNNQLPWVASNYRPDGFEFSRRIARGGQTLTVFSWLDPAQDPQAAMGSGASQAVADSAKLKQALQQAQQQGSLTLLATSLPLDQAKKELPLQEVDILLVRSAYEVYGEPQKVGDTLVLQPGSRGMRLGHVNISLNDQGRIDHYEHTSISMPSTMSDDEALLPWYEEYNAKVKESYEKRVALRKARETGQSPFVGEEACQSCHEQEHKMWRDSLHSEAFYKLEDVNKAFDPSCIQCHTVGFDTDGGFIDIDATPNLMNVQCENCHGAGRTHAEAGGAKPLANSDWQPEQMCAQCHVQKHSPSFNFDRYWPRIRHGAMK